MGKKIDLFLKLGVEKITEEQFLVFRQSSFPHRESDQHFKLLVPL